TTLANAWRVAEGIGGGGCSLPERAALADVGGRERAVVDRDLVGETAAVLAQGAAVVHHAPRRRRGGGPGGVGRQREPAAVEVEPNLVAVTRQREVVPAAVADLAHRR